MNTELDRLRGDIDSVDHTLVKLLKERMELSERIAEVKASENLPITDANREADVISSAAEAAGSEYRAEAIIFMKMLISLSKLRQNRLLAEKSRVWNKNIVFIGLPGSGKTTVSAQVAKTLGRPWFDSDAEIEKEEGQSIPELFIEKGEEYFRRREAEHILGLMSERNTVIAAGGGAVLRLGDVMRQNATVVYLVRDTENIIKTLEPGSRPLFSGKEQLDRLSEQRRELYEAARHITIDNNGNIETAVNETLAALKRRETENE